VPEKLATQIAAMRKAEAVLSYTDYDVHDESGSFVFRFTAPAVTTYTSMLKRPSIGCSTAIMDIGTLGKRYFPGIRKSEDLALWLSILREYRAVKCGGVLTHYTARRVSVSSNKLASAYYTWRVFREHEHMRPVRAAYYFSHYAAGNVAKRIRGSLNTIIDPFGAIDC
jgi:hypothetical protein